MFQAQRKHPCPPLRMANTHGLIATSNTSVDPEAFTKGFMFPGDRPWHTVTRLVWGAGRAQSTTAVNQEHLLDTSVAPVTPARLVFVE